MTNMIERVARAIKDARALPGTKPVARVSDVDRRAARAAIEAMREPTAVMVAASIAGLEGKQDSKIIAMATRSRVVSYRKMITAALSQEER